MILSKKRWRESLGRTTSLKYDDLVDEKLQHPQWILLDAEADETIPYRILLDAEADETLPYRILLDAVAVVLSIWFAVTLQIRFLLAMIVDLVTAEIRIAVTEYGVV